MLRLTFLLEFVNEWKVCIPGKSRTFAPTNQTGCPKERRQMKIRNSVLLFIWCLFCL